MEFNYRGKVINYFTSTSIRSYGLLFIFCIPLFFINIGSSHDWGDDFAQYIHQARNMAQGIQQSITGYVYNPDYPMLGPSSYPVGFPLLLSPVCAVFGTGISCFLYLETLFLVLTALLLLTFLKQFYSSFVSVLIVLLYVYNPWVLHFKMEVMSDIPFSFFFFLCYMIYQNQVRQPGLRQSTPRLLVLAVLMGFLTSVRTIGVVFIVAVLLAEIRCVLSGKQKEFQLKQLIPCAVLCLGSVSTYLVLNKLIFRTGQALLSENLSSFRSAHFKTTVLQNLSYYLNVLQHFFAPENNSWQFIQLFSGSLLFAFLVLGILKRMSEASGFMEILFFVYLGTLIVYPYSLAGFRFVLPLIPFVLYYIVQGLLCIRLHLKLNKSIFASGLFIFTALSYKTSLSEMLQTKNAILPGPQQKESREAFDYIQSQTAANATFDFIKPRALALYTGRRAMSHRPLQSLSEIRQALVVNKVDYLVVHMISDDSLKAYVSRYADELDLCWSNRTFRIYRLKTVAAAVY